ncbi:hypothetical protein [Amaricoccus sp.]|uniref:hypothetical protein n=1 Tax=Amaricoccus sp. TaxID=1872485 RepID=UPI0025C3EC2E|nr:hypothetical protein [Amaricoccus sp.]
MIDNGKPLPEAEWDLADAAGCFDFYADLAEELDGEVEEIGCPTPASPRRRYASRSASPSASYPGTTRG